MDLNAAVTFSAIQDLVVEHKLFPVALSMILEYLYRVPFQGWKFEIGVFEVTMCDPQ